MGTAELCGSMKNGDTDVSAPWATMQMERYGPEPVTGHFFASIQNPTEPSNLRTYRPTS
jgi:hypothetical protein